MAWLSDWQYRKKITIDETKVDADLTNFPVLVKLTSANFDFAKALSTGYDVRFCSADGTTLLKYERERHDQANSLAEYWVKIPAVSGTVNTEFYIYYKNPSAADGADPTNVWDANFLSVHHSVDATTSTIKDSTGNNDDGTKVAANRPITATGRIGLAEDYETSTSDYITLTNNQAATKNFTIEAWVKRESTGSVYHTIAADWYSGINGFIFDFWGGATPNRLGFCSGGTWKYSTSTITDTGNFYHVVAVLDNSATPNVQFYINGAPDGDNQATTANIAPNYPIVLGKQGAGGGSGNYFDGIIDEVRYSNTARSAAWLKASYNSGNDSLVSYGGEEKRGGGGFFLLNFG